MKITASAEPYKWGDFDCHRILKDRGKEIDNGLYRQCKKMEMVPCQYESYIKDGLIF